MRDPALYETMLLTIFFTFVFMTLYVILDVEVPLTRIARELKSMVAFQCACFFVAWNSRHSNKQASLAAAMFMLMFNMFFYVAYMRLKWHRDAGNDDAGNDAGEVGNDTNDMENDTNDMENDTRDVGDNNTDDPGQGDNIRKRSAVSEG